MARNAAPEDDHHESSDLPPAAVPVVRDRHDDPLIQDRRVQMSLDEVDDMLPDTEEPLALVDAPVQVRKPLPGRERHRSHRPLPT